MLNDIGNLDFIATTIAINLATEFWPPIINKVESIINNIATLVDEEESQIELNRLDSETKKHLESGCSKYFATLKDEAEIYAGKTILLFKTFAFLASIIGLVLLYLGLKNGWNLLLLSPVPLTSVIYLWGMRRYKNKVAYGKMQAEEAIGEHAKGGKLIDKSFKLG